MQIEADDLLDRVLLLSNEEVVLLGMRDAFDARVQLLKLKRSSLFAVNVEEHLRQSVGGRVHYVDRVSHALSGLNLSPGGVEVWMLGIH